MNKKTVYEGIEFRFTPSAMEFLSFIEIDGTEKPLPDIETDYTGNSAIAVKLLVGYIKRCWNHILSYTRNGVINIDISLKCEWDKLQCPRGSIEFRVNKETYYKVRFDPQPALCAVAVWSNIDETNPLTEFLFGHCLKSITNMLRYSAFVYSVRDAGKNSATRLFVKRDNLSVYNFKNERTGGKITNVMGLAPFDDTCRTHRSTKHWRIKEDSCDPGENIVIEEEHDGFGSMPEW